MALNQNGRPPGERDARRRGMQWTQDHKAHRLQPGRLNTDLGRRTAVNARNTLEMIQQARVTGRDTVRSVAHTRLWVKKLKYTLDNMDPILSVIPGGIITIFVALIRKPVHNFSNGGLPFRYCMWRGNYNHQAIDFGHEDDNNTVLETD